MILRLFAIVNNKGNPGEGNKKLSPYYAKSKADIQMAILPPDVKNTFYLVIL
jgi:hypothetical protein